MSQPAMSQDKRVRSHHGSRAPLVEVSLVQILLRMFVCTFVLTACARILGAQDHSRGADLSKLAWSTDSTGPRRFVSVHGRRAAIFGYGQNASQSYPGADGLEVWAYPVQILSSYSVAFRQAGEATAIDGATILRRIVYSPEAVTRVYAGPDFIVQEKLFVPLDEPGAIITYDVESKRPIDIEIRFTPVLDLMWPASIGGQETLWSSAASAYWVTELTHRFSASIGSPDIVTHDDTQNTSKHVGRAPGLAFTIRVREDHKARVIVAAASHEQDLNVLSKKLLTDSAMLEKGAVDHYSSLLDHDLQIETPDADVNRTLAWSEIALDQAWVCNPNLGCGIVAGYGPSRRARRPQYDWFFAGDGMVAIQGLLAAGDYARAREELEFILKYQDKRTGMIWHEMSQSAGLLDWAKYPYMFVHVDLTFQFLSTVGDYFSITGDRQFVTANWSSIQSAYEYCRSTLDAHDGLPRIPADKEGGREQDALSDEMMLSASWASSAEAFAQLANATAHVEEAAQASAASQAARTAIGQRYWDARQHLWITGFTHSSTPLIDHDIGPARIMDNQLFSAEQRASLLDQIASADFQTDWGTRGNAASASSYNPNSYSSGSVWATGTSEIARAFWAEHRPATALPIWSALVPWSSLDSLGHIHEALAGDYYHEEVESVPEQTWSSSSFLSAAVHGLLGLKIDGTANRITFAPHLPAAWNAITLRNLRAGASEIGLTMLQSADEVTLQMQNQGAPVAMVFDPEIPVGATLKTAQLRNEIVGAVIEENPQDTHARVEFTMPRGSTTLTIEYRGGVAIISDPPNLMVGEGSHGIKITGVSLKGRVYTVDFDYVPSEVNSFEVSSGWEIKSVQGAAFKLISPTLSRFTVDGTNGDKEKSGYQHGKVTIQFAQ
jgi:glycogen debranching enzyme